MYFNGPNILYGVEEKFPIFNCFAFASLVITITLKELV